MAVIHVPSFEDTERTDLHRGIDYASVMVAVAAYTPDLMDRSKISAAAPGTKFVASAEALVGLAGVDTIVVDLNKKGVLDALPRIVACGTRLIAYGSHVDHALLAAAAEAGCQEVLPRSKFFATLAELLG